MYKFITCFLLIFWMILSLFLACSVIGLLLFVRADYNLKSYQGDSGMSSWFKLGHKLLDKFIENG